MCPFISPLIVLRFASFLFITFVYLILPFFSSPSYFPIFLQFPSSPFYSTLPLPLFPSLLSQLPASTQFNFTWITLYSLIEISNSSRSIREVSVIPPPISFVARPPSSVLGPDFLHLDSWANLWPCKSFERCKRI